MPSKYVSPYSKRQNNYFRYAGDRRGGAAAYYEVLVY